MRRRGFVPLPAVLLVVLLIRSFSEAAVLGPQTVVRKFCQADGLGQRASIQHWPVIAPLVGWTYEPAWDHVVLIDGYVIGSPRPTADGALSVEVNYHVVRQVSAFGVEDTAQMETVQFVLKPDPTWRISGPPLPPHILVDRVDVESLQQSIQEGGFNYTANSLFLWHMFRSAGWNIPFERTSNLLNGTVYRVVRDPKPGDVVAYLRDGQPYHVALLEGKNQVVSSTLNAGIVRSRTKAFAGEVKYLRLVQPDPLPPIDALLGDRADPEGRPSVPGVVSSTRSNTAPRMAHQSTRAKIQLPPGLRPSSKKRAETKMLLE